MVFVNCLLESELESLLSERAMPFLEGRGPLSVNVVHNSIVIPKMDIIVSGKVICSFQPEKRMTLKMPIRNDPLEMTFCGFPDRCPTQ
jgi:hypothetical protein